MLLDEVVATELAHTKWAESHGAANSHLSLGALYFALPYMLKARSVVCLGSGGGFVPRCMVSAQRQLVAEGSINRIDAHLVDAHIGPWGQPVYDDSPDQDLVRHRMLTDDAINLFAHIDYLHVDADHSYEQTLADLRNYGAKMRGDSWAITVHDTWNVNHVGPPALGTWRAAVDYATERGCGIVNFKIGCGTALLSPRDGH